MQDAIRGRAEAARKRCQAGLVLILLGALPVAAATPPSAAAPPAGGIVDLDAMVVRGEQPGPGLWKVSRNGHVLWILGTIAPLPRDLQWSADEVEQAIAQSQQVLEPPYVTLDAHFGFFAGLAMLPSALKAMKNPDGARLDDVLPPDLYARWLPLKQRYLGRDGGIEKKRPMFAAGELYEAAVRKSGLSPKPVVWPVVVAAAKRHGLKPVPTKLAITISDPKQALADYRASGIDDRDCFRSVLDAVQNDLPGMVERANAWSMGDVEALQAMPLENPVATCGDALSNTEFARRWGADHVGERLRAHWLEIARRSIAEHSGTFAVLPLSNLLGEQGYLAALRAEGYEIEAPE